ncbi:hypothetical protein GMORB2_5167 [Geosmithia morbida]|uniref:Uncharacterized protein n=1 Tax=Geosmithia morbida TaxID=1094350 RepID=A0A9P5D5F5_9HYPO|nr:uncharacterized protein GMORB2_5167 [Geosmithia morbida]KAF4124501.1 hypothetical protein GMORB2_5167 [Geosmithia morbida]
MEALLKIADNFALGTLPVPEHPDDTIGQDESRIHEDTNAAASSPSASSSIEQRLEDEIRLRQFTENVLDSRQQELEAQEATNRELAAKVEELKRELASTQEQLAEARGQARAKGKKLSDARDQIFRLQPTRKDVTETEAVEGFRGLCSNVQRWVENRMKPILDDLDVGKLRARAPSTAGATRLTSFMREAARRGMHIDQSDIYHVTAVVMNYLSLVFFSKSFYSPLDDYEGDATLTFLNELELSMSRLPRGKKMPIKAICRPTVLVFGGDVEVAVKPTVLGWLWEGSAQTGRETPTRPTATRSKSFWASVMF